MQPRTSIDHQEPIALPEPTGHPDLSDGRVAQVIGERRAGQWPLSLIRDPSRRGRWPKSELAERLACVFTHAGYDPQTLADTLGVGRQTVLSWFGGATSPRGGADAVLADLDAILRGEEPTHVRSAAGRLADRRKERAVEQREAVAAKFQRQLAALAPTAEDRQMLVARVVEEQARGAALGVEYRRRFAESEDALMHWAAGWFNWKLLVDGAAGAVDAIFYPWEGGRAARLVYRKVPNEGSARRYVVTAIAHVELSHDAIVVYGRRRGERERSARSEVCWAGAEAFVAAFYGEEGTVTDPRRALVAESVRRPA